MQTTRRTSSNGYRGDGNQTERQNLVLSFSELNEISEGEEANYYFSAGEAFFGDSLFQFVADEVHAMLLVLFCHTPWLSSFFNPLYAALFAVLYLLSLPGALLHWFTFDFFPVRSKENPEERELRSQGIYVAVGLSIISIPFDAVGLYLGSDVMQAINMVSLAVNCGLILFNLLGLKALGGELHHAMRTYIVGIWIILVCITALVVFDVFYFSYTWITILTYCLRLLAILVYLMIAVHVAEFWDSYGQSDSKGSCEDVGILHAEVVLLTLVLAGFGYAVYYISEANAWQVLL
jgi:small-conductance mechanosensitive channel